MSLTAHEALEKALQAAIRAESCHERTLYETAAANAQISQAWSAYAQARQLIVGSVGVVQTT